MNSHPPDGDSTEEMLLAELADAIAETTEIPGSYYEKAIAAFEWRTINEELEFLILTHDSVMAEAGTMRGEPVTPRILTFEAPNLTIDLEVGHQSIAGQLIPPTNAHITMESPYVDPVQVVSDEFGCFVLRPTPLGPIRLRCVLGDLEHVTEWTTL